MFVIGYIGNRRRRRVKKNIFELLAQWGTISYRFTKYIWLILFIEVSLQMCYALYSIVLFFFFFPQLSFCKVNSPKLSSDLFVIEIQLSICSG